MIVQALLLLLSTRALPGFQVAEDCSETEGAELVKGVCQCREPDHVISSDGSSCLPIVFDGYGGSCSDTSQCVARMSTGAKCVDGSCLCVENFHYLHGRCWRNRGYGEACSENSSCYAYAESDTLVCGAGKCRCGAYTYSPHKEMCRRPAAEGEPCDFDLDCGGALCNTTTYTCDPVVGSTTTGTTEESLPTTTGTTDDSLPTTTGTTEDSLPTTTGTTEDSLPTTTGTTEDSLPTTTGTTEDSLPTTTGTTEDSLPTTTGTTEESLPTTTGTTEDSLPTTTGTTEESLPTTTGTTEESLPTTTGTTEESLPTTTGTTEESLPTTTGTTEGSLQTMLFSAVGVPEDQLKTCEDCDGYGKECTAGGQCVCAMGFFDTTGNGTCLPELGEPCSSDSDCAHIAMSLCRRSGSTGGRVCGCQGSWAPEVNNRACVKSRKYNFNCQQDAQCSYYGGFCLNKKKCSCPEGSHFTGQLCWPAVGLGDECSDPRDCSVPSGEGVDCINNVCKCSEGYRNTSTSDCWKIPEALGDPCEAASECNFTTAMSLVTCDDNTCSCVAGFTAADSVTCVVGVGGPCVDDVDCAAVPTYKCVNGSCACPEGTIVGMFTGECLEEATEFGGRCTEVTQCSHVVGEHAVCDEQGTCRCAQGYHYRQRTCWPTKRLGDECLRASECYSDQHADRLECRNSVCACKFDFQEDTDSKTCSLSSTTVPLSLAAMAVCYLLLWSPTHIWLE